MNSEFPQHLIAAFDGLYTMAYFSEDLRPYCNKDGDKTIEGLYEDAEKVNIETMRKKKKMNTLLVVEDEKLIRQGIGCSGRSFPS